MDSDLHSPSNSAGAKAAFHKPTTDPSNRKYRRRSPVSGSSSSDGEPVRERSSTPARSLDDNSKHNDNRQRKDERRDIDRDQKRSRYSRDGGSSRNADRRSYNDRRHDDYKRREKYSEEDQKNFHKSSKGGSGSGSHGSYSDHARRESEPNRSRDNPNKHSRDRSDGSAHRSRDRDKYKKDDFRDEKRTLKDGKSESLPTLEEPKSHRSGHHHKDASWRDSKELNDPKYTRDGKGKSYDQEPKGLKDRHFKEPRELIDDKNVLATKKSKFSMDKDTEYSKDAIKHATEVQSSSLKQGQEFVGKANAEQDCVKESDIDAAKIAAMKAAELVNRNLIGTGIMSTDQKKKLLWGSKKSNATEEAAHRWDTSMFTDRERQEKFNKLMSLRLHWYLLWPIVGCERGRENGAKTRDPKHQSCRKAKRASNGLGKAVHGWSSSQRWPYRWFRALKIISQYQYRYQYQYQNLLYLCTSDMFYAIKLYYRLKILILMTILKKKVRYFLT